MSFVTSGSAPCPSRRVVTQTARWHGCHRTGDWSVQKAYYIFTLVVAISEPPDKKGCGPSKHETLGQRLMLGGMLNFSFFLIDFISVYVFYFMISIYFFSNFINVTLIFFSRAMRFHK